MESPLDKSTEVPKPPGSVKKKNPATSGAPTAQDKATKPIEKKKPKIRPPEDADSKADSALKSAEAQVREKPRKHVSNQVPKTPETSQSSRTQSAADVVTQDKFRALDPQAGDSAKKVTKKKQPSLPEQPEQTQTPVDQTNKKKKKKKSQPQEDVKQGMEKVTPSDSPAPTTKKPGQVHQQLKEASEKQKPKFKPSLPTGDDAPEPIKKTKKPAPPPAPEPVPELEHGGEVETEPEEGEENHEEEDHGEEDHEEEDHGEEDHGEEDHEEEDHGEEDHEEEDREDEDREDEDHEDEDHEDEDREEGDHEDEGEYEEEYEEESNFGPPLAAAKKGGNQARDIAAQGKDTKTARDAGGAAKDLGDKAQNAGKDTADQTKRLAGNVPGADDLGQTKAADKAKDETKGTRHKASETASGAKGEITAKAGKLRKSSKGAPADAASSSKEEFAKRSHEDEEFVAKVHEITGEIVEEPEGLFTDDIDVTGEAGEDFSQDEDTGGGLAKQDLQTSGEVTNKVPHDTVEGLEGKSSSTAGTSVNETATNFDAHEDVAGVNQAAEGKGQDANALKGFMPGMEQSGSVDVNGIQVSIQSTKDGISLNINIPRFEQQQQ